MDLTDDLALALELADVADGMTLPRFRAMDARVETKPDLSPVTEVDRAVEERLRSLLHSRRPLDAVVGEEHGVDGPPGAPRQWVIDPIDGTKNFVRGMPVYATLIALQSDAIGLVGVVSAPALGRRWWAARGVGAFADGRSIQVSKVADLADAHFSYSSIAGWGKRGRHDAFLDLTRRVWRTRAFGDFWSHVLVAEGSVDIAAEPEVALWDLAAVQVLVEEAGGQFSDLAGVPTADGGSAISTNGLLHDDVVAALRPRDLSS